MMTRLRRFSAAAAAATLALTMAACSSDEPAAEAEEPAAQATEAPAAEETTESAPLPEPEHGDAITEDQAADLPEALVAVELGNGTLVAVDGTQPFPDQVVSYVQDLVPPPAEHIDMEDPDANDWSAQDTLRAELVKISEATGRRPVVVVNAGYHDEQGNLTGDGWLPQLHSELTELSMKNNQSGIITLEFSDTADGAVALLEGLIAELEDPSVWEIIPPRS